MQLRSLPPSTSQLVRRWRWPAGTRHAVIACGMPGAAGSSSTLKSSSHAVREPDRAGTSLNDEQQAAAELVCAPGQAVSWAAASHAMPHAIVSRCDGCEAGGGGALTVHMMRLAAQVVNCMPAGGEEQYTLLLVSTLWLRRRRAARRLALCLAPACRCVSRRGREAAKRGCWWRACCTCCAQAPRRTTSWPSPSPTGEAGAGPGGGAHVPKCAGQPCMSCRRPVEGPLALQRCRSLVGTPSCVGRLIECGGGGGCTRVSRA